MQLVLVGWWTDVYGWDEFPGVGSVMFTVAEAVVAGPSLEPGRQRRADVVPEVPDWL